MEFIRAEMTVTRINYCNDLTKTSLWFNFNDLKVI